MEQSSIIEFKSCQSALSGGGAKLHNIVQKLPISFQQGWRYSPSPRSKAANQLSVGVEQSSITEFKSCQLAMSGGEATLYNRVQKLPMSFERGWSKAPQ